MSEDFVARRAG